MSKDEKDILEGHEELKKMPFRIPEGYFDSLEAKIQARIAEDTVPAERRPSRDMVFRIPAYLSAAAVLAIIVTGGLLLMLHGGMDADDWSEDQYALYRDVDIIPVTEPEAIWLSSYEDTSGSLSAEDIIDYLVYIGIEPEEFDNY